MTSLKSTGASNLTRLEHPNLVLKCRVGALPLFPQTGLMRKRLPSLTALFLGTFPSEVGFARYGAQAAPSHRRSGTLTFNGRGLHIGHLPNPRRIDVDGGGDIPVDLERGSAGDIPPTPSGRLFPRWGIGNPARGLSLLIRRSGAVISDDRDEAGYECRPDKL